MQNYAQMWKGWKADSLFTFTLLILLGENPAAGFCKSLPSKNGDDFSVIDSLQKYTLADSLIFYQKMQGEIWISTDTVDGVNSNEFYRTDINADGYSDVIIPSMGPAGTDNKVFLFNRKSGLFQHNEQFDLPNISCDFKGKTIRSQVFYPSITACQYEMR